MLFQGDLRSFPPQKVEKPRGSSTDLPSDSEVSFGPSTWILRLRILGGMG